MRPSPDILECTLRDGSYVIDFQFTAEDTRRIAGRLDALGFPLIEVGHGIGLGASERNMGTAAATDEEYMIATNEAVSKGLWGMFCIPGIAELRHVDMGAANGMDFIRIGSEVSDVESMKPFIERARAKGIRVYSNLMKSYACAPADFATQAAKCVDYGAECVYIVDSAGGMIPSEIGEYIDAFRQASPGTRVGFHGHNNLGMGVANALYCADRGLDVIDTSLQGFGRSAGNTATESFISILIRAGYQVPFDPIDVMQAGEELIRPLIRDYGMSSLDITAGLAMFHSSFMQRVLRAAKSHRVDPRRLIVALCARDRINAPPDLIEQAVRDVQAAHPPLSPLVTKQYFGEEQK